MDLEFRGEVQARDKYLEFISRQMILEATEYAREVSIYKKKLQGLRSGHSNI